MHSNWPELFPSCQPPIFFLNRPVGCRLMIATMADSWCASKHGSKLFSDFVAKEPVLPCSAMAAVANSEVHQRTPGVLPVYPCSVLWAASVGITCVPRDMLVWRSLSGWVASLEDVHVVAASFYITMVLDSHSYFSLWMVTSVYFI